MTNLKSYDPSALLQKLTTTSPESLPKLRALFQERSEVLEENKAIGYIPNGKAEQFIKMVGSGKNFINMFIAANGVGKSAAGVNIITNICYGAQNEWFDYPLFKSFPYVKKGRIISDPTTIKEKIIPELKKWFPGSDATKLPVAN